MLLGRKIGMTQIYQEDGSALVVTVVQAGPCVVLQKKASETNGGHNAVQLGFEPVKDKNARKPQIGHAKKAGMPSAFRFARDMRVENLDEFELGQELTVTQFEPGQVIDVTGTSHGKGFQGVMKRHNHKGGPRSHGSMFHRSTGGIGASASPARVLKLRPMPGHMGNERVTVQSLKIVAVYPDDNLIAISGSIPGPKKGFVIVRPTIKILNKK